MELIERIGFIHVIIKTIINHVGVTNYIKEFIDKTKFNTKYYIFLYYIYIYMYIFKVLFHMENYQICSKNVTQ